MKKEQFIRILQQFYKACEEVNKENKKSNLDNKVIYEVLQFSEIAKEWDTLYKVADFYNYNWTGNADFMHIPNFEQILQNCRKYPIIIAREEDSNEILGISTIKYDENTKENIDPYFPEENAKYFSITGILAKKGSSHKGVGKKIYEIALKGAYNYEKYAPGTKIMCVIDCRNNNSLKALEIAVQKASEDLFPNKSMELPAYIDGYYELRDENNNNLLEAPTIVLVVELHGKEKKENLNETETIEYEKKEGEELFNSLSNTIMQRLGKCGIKSPIINKDENSGKVLFYPLNEKYKIGVIEIEANGTERGNDRKPQEDHTKNIQGPHIAWEGEER